MLKIYALQAFSKAFDKIDSFNDDFLFSTWLISIAKNLHVDLIRKEKFDYKNQQV
ncbi:MAG: hypothetical protein CM15mP83_6010 [Flavobacteriaceae bacterium]|nr:MAG: hypothetical protein CM15mP83_6010 [Flavobacteriaceae bacterium]